MASAHHNFVLQLAHVLTHTPPSLPMPETAVCISNQPVMAADLPVAVL